LHSINPLEKRMRRLADMDFFDVSFMSKKSTKRAQKMQQGHPVLAGIPAEIAPSMLFSLLT
jgi:hypothetical protein